jgi:hypothetical protein
MQQYGLGLGFRIRSRKARNARGMVISLLSLSLHTHTRTDTQAHSHTHTHTHTERRKGCHDEDMEQGYPQGSTDSRSSRKAAYEFSLSGREDGEGGARNKDAEEDAQKEPVRTYTGKKRGRKPREQHMNLSHPPRYLGAMPPRVAS